ncbi:alanine racemase [Sporichthya polymorpha]|uniref:alanine racemase n=1 Tax=Sporichthya polymorpha TaxID=35751 RepID=UPI00036DBB9A|nr:alanine racemase [Sporichthya polymorpha]
MLRLEIDRARFDAHLQKIDADIPGLVPVAKGNGYGLTMDRCVDEALTLGADTLAVGTFAEARRLPERAEGFSKVVVLTPHLPGDPTEGLPIALFGRVVHTVATAEAAATLAGKRVVVECRTSLRRHGVGADDLPGLAAALSDVRLEGFALHLPMNRPRGAHPVTEVATWVERLKAAKLPAATIYVSHLSGPEVAGLGKQFPETTFRARVGTKLWLGDRGALRPKARVLDVEKLARGDRYGYRQRKAPRDGHLVVVAGGTAHGVGLSAPKPVAGLMTRVKIAGEGTLATFNRTLSPFTWAGKQRWFAEPPHMQVSLLWLPAGVEPPAVGDYLDVETRMTTTTFDEIVEV